MEKELTFDELLAKVQAYLENNESTGSLERMEDFPLYGKEIHTSREDVGKRWTDVGLFVYEYDGRYLGVFWDVPKTECQESGYYNAFACEVEPTVVTITKYIQKK